MFERLKRIIIRYRDAITGKFVTKQYAEENPSTTVKEKRKVDVREVTIIDSADKKPKRKYTKRKSITQ